MDEFEGLYTEIFSTLDLIGGALESLGAAPVPNAIAEALAFAHVTIKALSVEAES